MPGIDEIILHIQMPAFDVNSYVLWDLKSSRSVPIASNGFYIAHIHAVELTSVSTATVKFTFVNCSATECAMDAKYTVAADDL